MDADEIGVFLALAEELHFGRTAQRLHLPQSRVSRLIASLERRVGGALFERTSRRVTLTPLGARLRDQAGPAYASLLTALAEASSRARGAEGVLRVGCTITVGGPMINRLAQEFSSSYPSCELSLHEVPAWEPYAGLRCGDIDVLINWLILDEPDLVAGPVLEYRDRVLAMRRGHRLAGRDSVSFEDLADEETHSPPHPDKYPAALADAIIPRITPSGRPVRRTVTTWSLDDLFAWMARTDLVHPTMAGVALFQRDDTILIPIRDMPPMPLGLIWRAASENARIRALAAVARRLASAAQPRRAVLDDETSPHDG
jgi:DNA-binding transcriptional LysR family regulator